MLQFVGAATGKWVRNLRIDASAASALGGLMPWLARSTLIAMQATDIYVTFAILGFLMSSLFRQATAIKMGLLIVDILRVSAQFWMFSMHAAAMLFMCCSQVIFAGAFRLCVCVQSLPSVPERHYRRSPRAFCAAAASREPRPTGG
jgi:hypothetical protein